LLDELSDFIYSFCLDIFNENNSEIFSPINVNKTAYILSGIWYKLNYLKK
jgi:hypothetical protein